MAAKALDMLSVILPCYNEEKRLRNTLLHVHEWLCLQGRPFEILIVNDGSIDGTAQLVKEIAVERPEIHLIENDCNRGKGFSVKHGVQCAIGEHILFSDADLSTPIEELLVVEPFLDDHDVVFGSRFAKGRQPEVPQPLYRKVMGRVFNLLVQGILLPGVTDSQCGFKLFTKKAAKDIFSKVTIERFGFDIELLYLARKLGYRSCEVPIRWRNDTDTKVSAVRDSAAMFLDVFRVRARHKHLKSHISQG